MIEKMKFLSITGPKDDIDRVVDQYLSKYEIQLENALSELKTVANLRPYLEINPYKAELQTAAALMEEIKGNKAVDGHGRDTGTITRGRTKHQSGCSKNTAKAPANRGKTRQNTKKQFKNSGF